MANVLYFYAMIMSITLIYIIGDISKILRNILAVFVFIYSLISTVLLTESGFSIPVMQSMNINMSFSSSGIGSFFVILNHIAFGIILVNILNNMKTKMDNGFFFMMFLIFYLSTLMFMSSNLFTFFIMWEFISVLIYLNTGILSVKKSAGLKYLSMNAAGGLLLLAAVALIYNYTGSLDFSRLSSLYYLIPYNSARLIVLLFTSAMLIKSAFWGLHTWVNDAYMESNTGFTAYLSAILSKMGIFGLIVLYFRVFPYDYIIGLFTFSNISFFTLFFAIGGSLTALFATIVAVKQQNIKSVLTYSSVAQIGYILASFGLGYSWALISVMTVVTVHMLVKTSLFTDLFFIEYKTGSTDAGKLGGLIKVIPFTFISTLISIIALAGIVPLMGFSAKWIYYGNMFISGHYIPLTISLLASTIAFLYCYKILSTVFLGQLSDRNAPIRYFNSFGDYAVTIVNMIIPAGLVFFGIYPYPFFNFMLARLNELVPSPNILISGNFIESSIGYWNPLWIGSAVIITFISMLAIFIIFFKKSARVSQTDIAMSAEIINRNTPLHYVSNFYDGFIDAVNPILKINSERFYRTIYTAISDTGDLLKRVHFNSLTSKNMMIGLLLLILIIYLWSAV